LGIVPTAWKYLLTVDESHPAERSAGQYHFYLVAAFDGEPRNLQPEEHAFISWFEFEEALKLPFPHPLYAEMIRRIEQESEQN
jgi:8-oxo-dGTP pyrophosphatase MutT (NUDIX family)